MARVIPPPKLPPLLKCVCVCVCLCVCRIYYLAVILPPDLFVCGSLMFIFNTIFTITHSSLSLVLIFTEIACIYCCHGV